MPSQDLFSFTGDPLAPAQGLHSTACPQETKASTGSSAAFSAGHAQSGVCGPSARTTRGICLTWDAAMAADSRAEYEDSASRELKTSSSQWEQAWQWVGGICHGNVISPGLSVDHAGPLHGGPAYWSRWSWGVQSSAQQCPVSAIS